MATSGLIDVNLLSYYNGKLHNEFSTNELEANRAKIKIAEVTESLTAASASFSNIGLSRLTVTGKAIVQNLDVNNEITSNSIQTSTLNGNYISANNSITTPLLEATSISASQISAGDKIQAPIGEFETLKVDTIEADSLGTEYLKADGANITEAMIKKLFVDTGIFEEAVIKDGYVTGYLDAVHIRADSIVANKISLLGPDGLYYALNTEGATEGQTLENALDGSHIIAESITASKIRVSDLVAFGATIGGWTIDDTALRSRLKQAYDDAIPGVYFGSGLTKVEDYLTDENGNRLTDENGNDLYLLKTKQVIKYLSDGNGNYITDENGNLIGLYVDDESAYTFGFLCDDTDSSPSRLLLSSEGIDIRTPNFVVNRDTGAVFVNGSITIAETGEQLTDALDDAEKVATNYMSFESNYGLMIADMTDGVILPSEVTSTDDFRNVLIDSDSVDIRSGLNVLASFGEATTIGRTDVVGQRHISMSSTPSSSTFGIYRKLESGDSNDFVINSSDNEDSQETYTASPTNIRPSAYYTLLTRIPLAKGVGYEQVRVVCTHPNGSSTFEQTLDLTDSGTHSYVGNFSPDTGATCRYGFDNVALTSFVEISIMTNSDSSITTSSVFTIDLYYSGGVSTEFLIGGDHSLNSKFAVDVSGTLYSNGGVVPAGFAMGDRYWFRQELKWLSNNPYWITSGYITGSRKSIWFSVTLPKPMPFNGNGVRIITEILTLAIRVQNRAGDGAYLAADSSYTDENGEDYAANSDVTINAYVQTPTVVSFWLSSSSVFSISDGTLPNNVPLAIRIRDLEIIFDEVE